MKKLIIFMGVVLVFFSLFAFIIPHNEKSTSINDLYEKEKLQSSTIDHLSDPIYNNQINLKDLRDSITQGENIVVYFYSQQCGHCLTATPILVPIAESMKLDLKKINLLKYEDGWDEFKVEGTPTIIHYMDGKEISRIMGAGTEEDYKVFFSSIVKLK